MIAAAAQWQALTALYSKAPLQIGALYAIVFSAVGIVLLRVAGSKNKAARICVIVAALAAYLLLAVYPNACGWLVDCGPWRGGPQRSQSMFLNPAYADVPPELSIGYIGVDPTRSTFVRAQAYKTSIHGEGLESPALTFEYDRKMMAVVERASCRGVRGEKPIADALPVLKGMLAAKSSVAGEQISTVSGYKNLMIHGGPSAFNEILPTRSELEKLKASNPADFAIVMDWLVNCIGLLDPVLIWNIQNNGDRPLTIVSVDYDVLDIGSTKGGIPQVTEPIDVSAHDLEWKKGRQSHEIQPYIKIGPKEVAAIRIQLRLQADEPGLNWLLKATFNSAEGPVAVSSLFQIFGAKFKKEN
ncbi:hypothetical protein GCM10010520_13260 [Rhizobium viscosum]